METAASEAATLAAAVAVAALLGWSESDSMENGNPKNEGWKKSS